MLGIQSCGLEKVFVSIVVRWPQPPCLPNPFSYKYNIVVDGNAAPSQRLAVMLQSGSTLLRQETPSIEFYYDDLQPYVHYVPLSLHASDVLHKVAWCRRHDGDAKTIADAAARYARGAFTEANIACYWYRLLKRYAQLQRFRPEMNATYEAHRVRLGNMDALRDAGYACPQYRE